MLLLILFWAKKCWETEFSYMHEWLEFDKTFSTDHSYNIYPFLAVVCVVSKLFSLKMNYKG